MKLGREICERCLDAYFDGCVCHDSPQKLIAFTPEELGEALTILADIAMEMNREDLISYKEPLPLRSRYDFRQGFIKRWHEENA